MSEPAPVIDPLELELRKLFGAFDRPLTAEKLAAYRSSLGKLSEPALKRLVDHAIGEEGPEKLPTTRDCWRIHRLLQARGRVAPAPAPAWQGDEWDAKANLRLLPLVMRQTIVRKVSYYSPQDQARMHARGRSLEAHEIDEQTREIQAALMSAKAEWARVMRTWPEPPIEADQDETWRTIMRSAGQKISNIRRRHAAHRQPNGGNDAATQSA